MDSKIVELAKQYADEGYLALPEDVKRLARAVNAMAGTLELAEHLALDVCGNGHLPGEECSACDVWRAIDSTLSSLRRSAEGGK